MTSKRFFYTASRARRGCSNTSCSCKGHNHHSRVRHSAPEAHGRSIRKKQPRRHSVHLPPDNVRPHIAKAKHQKMEEQGWETMLRPSYSSDISPSDCHLFRVLKALLARKSFVKLEDLGRAVADFFHSRSHQFWERGSLTCQLNGLLSDSQRRLYVDWFAVC